MRPLLLAGFLLTAAAHAQAPAATAPPPAAPTPSQPAPTPPPAPTPDAPAPVSADTALLRGLLWTTTPAPDEVRAIAIEDLALLGDARALDPLAALLWDPSQRVRAAAVRAVALFQHPRAEEILSDVVRHPAQPEALKLQALGGLLFQRTATARALLQDVARNPRSPASLQSAALALAQRWDAAPSTPESTK